LFDESITPKKFIVVADSLPKLLHEIGEENYPQYFFMVDEIDSYQYDSTYRDKLEDVIDYYFKFPENKRCLVSATVNKFSNIKIEEEPVINVTFNNPHSREIKLLLHTNNIVKATVEQILEIREHYPDDKILVAYNSVQRGIKLIIESLREHLGEQLTTECAVLCSKSSKDYVEDYYSEIVEEDQLPKKINFMTCSYFVGIDVSERFHLISIADSRLSFTLLSEDKLLQIAGRCRNEEGLLSETIIYSSKARDSILVNNDYIDESELQKEIKEDAILLADCMNSIQKVEEKFPQLSNLRNDINLDEMLKGSEKSYFGTQSVKLVRKDICRKYQPAYMNIDNVLIQFNLLNTLYALPDSLYQSLAQNNNILDFQNIEEDTEENEEVQERVNESIRIVNTDTINGIIDELRTVQIEERERLAQSMKRKPTLTLLGKQFIDRFLELQKYVPFEQLVSESILPILTTKNPNQYNKFHDSVIFWALSEGHPFKIAFHEKFPLNVHITGNDIAERLNTLLMSSLGFRRRLSNNEAFIYLAIFCKKSNRMGSGQRSSGNYYIIESHDVNNFNIDPLETIPPTTDIHSRVFKFLKKR